MIKESNHKILFGIILLLGSILGDYGIYANELNAKSFSEAIINAYELYYVENKLDRLELRDYIIENYSWQSLYNQVINSIQE
ncbi:MAG: hypothetical protein U9N59_10320 [Campylobacterota bacterium]|nr:hypothetical protein [Campylobacterota bacterium]